MIDSTSANVPGVVDLKVVSKTGKSDQPESRGGFGDTLSGIRGNPRDPKSEPDSPTAQDLSESDGDDTVSAGSDKAGNASAAKRGPEIKVMDLKSLNAMAGARGSTTSGSDETATPPSTLADAKAAKAEMDRLAAKSAGKVPAAGDVKTVPEEPAGLPEGPVAPAQVEDTSIVTAALLAKTGPATSDKSALARLQAGKDAENAKKAEDLKILAAKDKTRSVADEGVADTVELPAETVDQPRISKARRKTDDAEADAPRTAHADEAMSILDSELMPVAATRATPDMTPPTAQDDTQSDTGNGARTVRISRADGKGKTMEVSLSNARQDADDFDPKAMKSLETVTVVDSRRYLGLALESNASSVLNAISSDSEWATAMLPSSLLGNAAAQASTGKVVNTLKLQMHPIELGLVTATLRLSGDDLTVDLTVANGAAYRQLSNDQSSIVDSLRAQGFAVDQVTVTLVSTDTSAGDGQSQQPGFSQSQAQDNSGAARRDEQQAGRRDAGNGGRSSGDLAANGGSASGSDGTRAGGLYL